MQKKLVLLSLLHLISRGQQILKNNIPNRTALLQFDNSSLQYNRKAEGLLCFLKHVQKTNNLENGSSIKLQKKDLKCLEELLRRPCKSND